MGGGSPALSMSGSTSDMQARVLNFVPPDPGPPPTQTTCMFAQITLASSPAGYSLTLAGQTIYQIATTLSL